MTEESRPEPPVWVPSRHRLGIIRLDDRNHSDDLEVIFAGEHDAYLKEVVAPKDAEIEMLRETFAALLEEHIGVMVGEFGSYHNPDEEIERELRAKWSLE